MVTLTQSTINATPPLFLLLPEGTVTPFRDNSQLLILLLLILLAGAALVADYGLSAPILQFSFLTANLDGSVYSLPGGVAGVIRHRSLRA